MERAIYWHQGLFMQPQHFQLTDKLATEQLFAALGDVRPYAWGVTECELDPGELEAGRVSPIRFGAVFPGGPRVVFPGNAVIAPRNLPEVPPAESLLVLVGLRAFRPGESNVTVAADQPDMALAPTRLVTAADPEMEPDLYAQGPSAPVRRLHLVLRLIWETERGEYTDHALLPLVRLIRTGKGFSIDRSYAPPSLRMAASPLLPLLLRSLRDQVVGKARQLEGYKNMVGRAVGTETAAMLLMLQTLYRHGVRLDTALEDVCFSPWQAYGLLREILAELSVFTRESAFAASPERDFRIPPYAHEDPLASLGPARDAVVRFLESISAGPRFLVRLERRGDRREASLPEHVLAVCAAEGTEIWGVLRSGSVLLEGLCDSAQRLMKLSASSLMSELVARAVPGLPFSVTRTPPPGMIHDQRAIYFRLYQDSPLWADVVRDKMLCLSWSEAPDDLEATLAVL